jgi:hypothetical protein
MATINCGECRALVSTQARTCPACGANRKVFRRPAGARQPMSWPKKIGMAFAAVFGLGVVGQIVTGGANQNAEEQSPRDKQTQHRDYAAYLSARSLKASLRNPDSLAFESILANDDGSVICMTYRAQNGFGGMNLEHVVFKNGDPNESHASWRANCAHKLLIDVTAVKSMI